MWEALKNVDCKFGNLRNVLAQRCALDLLSWLEHISKMKETGTSKKIVLNVVYNSLVFSDISREGGIKKKDRLAEGNTHLRNFSMIYVCLSIPSEYV